MINLLDLEAPGVTALERQSDEDAVVDGRTRPASRIQVLKVLEGDRNQAEKFSGELGEGDGPCFTFTAAVLPLRRLLTGGRVFLKISTAKRLERLTSLNVFI